MAKLVVTQTRNYTGETLLDIQAILFDTTAAATATFATNQFGPGEIENNVAITGDGFANTIRVNLSSAGTFSAAGWSFSNWSASDRVILAGTTGADTITGTAVNDTFFGGAGTDNLSGGGGDDIFEFNTGDLGSGEIINGGTQNSADRIRLASGGTYNFFAATVTGIELLQFSSTGVTAFLNASQLGAGAINAISGNTGFTQSISVGGSFADLSGVTFTGWGGTNQTISITGTSAAANTLTGSSQRDTIRGSGASVDTMTGGGGADSLLGGVGADTFRYLAVTDMVAGEAVDGGVGSDTLELLYSGQIDFRSATLASIERVEFGGTQGTQTATFRDDQFSESGIANTLAVEGSSAVNQIVVTADGFFSAGPWSFANWDASQDLITLLGGAGIDNIVGTSQGDLMEGGDRGDRLRGLAGDDTFVMRAGDVDTGERIEGGTHVNGDTISLLANADLSLATILGVERLSIGNLVSTTLTGDQIGGIDPDAIIQVSGAGVAATQSLTVNATAASGFSVDLSSETLFSGWGGASQTITINGNNQASDINELTGSVHRDTINGSVIASNVITGGRGADTLSGGNGFDTFVFVQPGDVEVGEVINGNGGFNQLRLDDAGTVNFRVVTLNDIQRLQFGTGESTALFQDDQVGVGLISQVSGSSGANVDSIVVDGASTDLSGVDFLSWSGDDLISLNGTNAADTLSGSNQNDTITGADGSDTLFGLGGNDVFRYNTSGEVDNDSIDGGEGTLDTLLLAGSGNFSFGEPSLVSISGIEGLTFGTSANASFAGSQIGASGQINVVTGSAGVDTLVVQGSFIDLTQVVFANWTNGPPSQAGTDRIQLLGTGGADTLTGSNQTDLIRGDLGFDTLSGGGGDDIFRFGMPESEPELGAGETIDGGQGDDTLDLANTGSSTESLDFSQVSLTSVERVQYSARDVIAIFTGTQIGAVGITTVIGSNNTLSDSLIVTGAFIDLTPVAFQSWEADDEVRLLGTPGADTLIGSSQNDRIDGGSGGADTMIGAGGDDTYIVDNLNDQVIEAFVQGTNDRVQTSTTYVLAAGSEVEVLETNDANALVLMDLVGNELNNTIIGNAATNTLVGGRGLDTLVGGGGADIYVWTAMNEMGAVVGGAADTVGPEFDANIGDRIAVNAIDVDGDGNTAEVEFTLLGEAATNPFTAPGQISWFNNVPGNETFILLNSDGDAEHDGVIRVLGVHTVDANWFVL